MNYYTVETGFSNAIEGALGPLHNYGGSLVAPSKAPGFDLAASVCFKMAKQLEISPEVIANGAASNIDLGYGTVSAFKGFINLRISDEVLVVLAHASFNLTPASNKGRVILDFGGPNIAKPMHVGHLRSLLIGNSLTMILSAVGYEVTTDIHYGDWGFQMGLILAAFADRDPETLEEIEAEYPLATQRAKDDEAFRAFAHAATVALQNYDRDHFARWRKIVKMSKDSVHADLAALGVSFDQHYGESDSQQFIPLVEKQLADTLFESDGAIVANTDYGFLLFRNQAGGYLYPATDLATIAMRHPNKLTKIIYVVDERQSGHFAKVFEVAKLITDAELVHVGFGTVNGPNGKPFRTREGGVPRLSSLIESALEKAKERSESYREIALAAIKFGDLSNSRKTSYAFDLDKFLSFEGRTGPYLLYQVARIHSILAQAQVGPGELVITTPEERDIVRELAFFPRVIQRSADQLEPFVIAEYTYLLAKAFSKDYGNGKKIVDNPSRLTLAKMVLARIEYCLGLLGIEPLVKM